MNIAREGHFERLKSRTSMEEWLSKGDFDLSVTLNFNRETPFYSARDKFGEWLQRLDSRYLGRSWQQQTNRRTTAVAFFENQQTNPHFHVVLRLPNPTLRRMRRAKMKKFHRLSWHTENFQHHWKKLMPCGSCHVAAIYDLQGIVRYDIKQLIRPGYNETYLISTEFHNS